MADATAQLTVMGEGDEAGARLLQGRLEPGRVDRQGAAMLQTVADRVERQLMKQLALLRVELSGRHKRRTRPRARDHRRCRRNCAGQPW